MNQQAREVRESQRLRKTGSKGGAETQADHQERKTQTKDAVIYSKTLRLLQAQAAQKRKFVGHLEK